MEPNVIKSEISENVIHMSNYLYLFLFLVIIIKFQLIKWYSRFNIMCIKRFSCAQKMVYHHTRDNTELKKIWPSNMTVLWMHSMRGKYEL